MSVSYDSKMLIPAPFVSISKETKRAENGTILGSLYNISLIGKILPFKGSPLSNGTFYDGDGDPPADDTVDYQNALDNLIKKREAIEDLFIPSGEGRALDIQGLTGINAFTCYPKNISVSFQDGNWVNYIDYTITMQAEDNTGTSGIKSYTDNWSIEPMEDNDAAIVTRSISAVGDVIYSDNGDGTLVKEPWVYAKDFVSGQLATSVDSTIMTDSNIDFLTTTGTDTRGYNYFKSTNIDKVAGNYSATLRWIWTSGNYLEKFNVDTITSAEDPFTNITINGEITGLTTSSTIDRISSRYDSANTAWTAISGIMRTRAQTFSNIDNLNVIPFSSTIGRNRNAGIITYNYVFNDRPSNVLPSTKSESIQVSDNISVDVIAKIPVPGRANGPVIQNMNTTQPIQRTLNMTLIFDPQHPSLTDCDYTTLPSGIITIMNLIKPPGTRGTDYFLESDQPTWDYRKFTYTRNTAWTIKNLDIFNPIGSGV